MGSTNIRFHAYTLLCCLAGSVGACQCEKANQPASSQGFVACTLDWRHAWPEYPLPDELRYCFYTTEGNSLIRMDSKQTAGMRFALPAGSYHILIFNCEPGAVPVQGIEQFEESKALLSGQTQLDIIEITGKKPLYAVIDTLTITPGCDKTIRLVPEPMVKKIIVRVDGKEIKAVEKCRATLSGLTTAMRLYNREKIASSPSSVSFELHRTEAGFEGNALVLNTSAPYPEKEKSADSRFTFNFTLTDGRTVSSNIELKDTQGETGNRGKTVKLHIEASFEAETNSGIRVNCRQIPTTAAADPWTNDPTGGTGTTVE